MTLTLQHLDPRDFGHLRGSDRLRLSMEDPTPPKRHPGTMFGTQSQNLAVKSAPSIHRIGASGMRKKRGNFWAELKKPNPDSSSPLKVKSSEEEGDSRRKNKGETTGTSTQHGPKKTCPSPGSPSAWPAPQAHQTGSLAGEPGNSPGHQQFGWGFVKSVTPVWLVSVTAWPNIDVLWSW